MKKWLTMVATVLLLLICLGSWYFLHTPLRVIDRLVTPLTVRNKTTQLVEHNGELRQYETITFQRARSDTFCVTISRPFKHDTVRRPVVILLGGLEIGRRSLQYIQRHGPNTIIAYEYPYRPQYWYEGTAIEEIPKIRHSVLIVPGQVTQLVQWAKNQNWADTSRFSLLGYSFGALAVPSVLRIMNRHGIRVQGVIMAYGGANLYEILKANLKTIPSLFRPLLARLIAVLIRPVEPALHLPWLQGDFLLINGQNDRQIPEHCWRLLHRLTPQHKEIVVLKAGHLHPKKKDLIRTIVRLSYTWLAKKDLINELPSSALE